MNDIYSINKVNKNSKIPNLKFDDLRYKKKKSKKSKKSKKIGFKNLIKKIKFY